MANELLRRSRILVVCGEADTEEMLEDIALAKRLRIAATTLEGILTIDNKAASNKPKKDRTRKKLCGSWAGRKV